MCAGRQRTDDADEYCDDANIRCADDDSEGHVAKFHLPARMLQNSCGPGANPRPSPLDMVS
jgi:hypothetical protein